MQPGTWHGCRQRTQLQVGLQRPVDVWRTETGFPVTVAEVTGTEGAIRNRREAGVSSRSADLAAHGREIRPRTTPSPRTPPPSGGSRPDSQRGRPAAGVVTFEGQPNRDRPVAGPDRRRPRPAGG